MTAIKPRDFKPKLKDNDSMTLIRQGEELIDKLSPEAMPQRRKFPESSFRVNFLPIMTGEAFDNLPEGYTEERLREEANRLWMNIAGGPGHEVEVTESDGRTAFIVPAVMDTSIINTFQAEKSPGLRHLAHEYQGKRHGMPSVANRILSQGLNNRLVRLFENGGPDTVAADKKIDAIREYYDIKTSDKKDAVQAETSNNYMGEFQF